MATRANTKRHQMVNGLASAAEYNVAAECGAALAGLKLSWQRTKVGLAGMW
jgi:hypothetical protein